jgi:hypothetical protein
MFILFFGVLVALVGMKRSGNTARHNTPVEYRIESVEENCASNGGVVYYYYYYITIFLHVFSGTFPLEPVVNPTTQASSL